MTEVRKSLSRRALAGVSALALGITGVAALSTAAFAAVGPDQPGHPEEGSLTIHKYLGAPTDPALPNDGTELNPAPENTAASGVEFTIQEVGITNGGACDSIDLTTPAGWAQVDEVVNAATLPVGYCLKPVTDGTKPTVGGTATFDELPLGLYYVTEGDDAGSNNIVQKAAPFYVTIPYPSGPQDGPQSGETTVEWTYEVHVYPKNATADKPTKTIDETQHGLKVGDEVTWTITQTVPTLNEDETFTQAQITDVFDSRLTYKSAVIKLDGTELDAADWEDGTPAQTWKFTTPGLLKLDAAQGKAITVELKTEVNSVGDGAIENGPWDGTNGYYSQFNNEPPIPGEDTPFTYWGELKVTKVDKSDPAKPLAGAEFAVYEAPSAGDCPATGAGVPIETGISGTDGVVMWGADPTATPPVAGSTPLGLLVQNSNTEITPAPSKDFCLYETKAPAGYSGVPVQKVTITAGALSVANGGDVTVANTQNDGPDLPLTGANGTLLMVLGGLGLVALAGGVHLVSKRRQAQDA